jgi:hypothetical protein
MIKVKVHAKMRKCLSTTLEVHLPSCLYLRNTGFHFPVSRFYFLFGYVRRITFDVTVKESACSERNNYSNNTIHLCLVWNPLLTAISRTVLHEPLFCLPDGSKVYSLIICHEKLFKHVMRVRKVRIKSFRHVQHF